MYIKKLELLNFQVIEKFSAEFDSNVYFITGDNELGKSTLLKAIGALFTGNRDEVLRNGASKGFAKMVVGDDGENYDVQLSFTEANPRGTLTIKQETTGMQTNNVSMLARIFGYQDFDAVDFSRWSETAEGRRKQIAVVKSLLPEAVRTRIDEIDAKVAELKNERTGVNRDVKTAASVLASFNLSQEFLDKYAAPVDMTELLEQAKKDAQLIERAKSIRASVAQRTQQIAEIPARIEQEKEEARKTIASYDERVKAAKEAYEKALAEQKDAMVKVTELCNQRVVAIEAEGADYEMRLKNGKDWLAKYEENNPETRNISASLEEAKAHNEKHELVRQYNERKREYDARQEQADSMDAAIAELGTERAGLIAKSSLPIDGLSFSEDGLTLNGVPFVPGKVSDSQTMEVATKLIIACNPKVKVFRIARGESLGEKRLQTIIDIAKRNGFQGFIEQVQRGQTEMLVEEYTER